MSNKNVSDLREHLFATLAALRDTENPMDIERARAVSDVAQTLINSAKVEVEYLKVAGSGESSFIDTGRGADNLPEAPPNGVTGITRHLLRG